MRPFAAQAIYVIASVVFLAGSASAQTTTRLYDHVHMAVADPQAAAQPQATTASPPAVDGDLLARLKAMRAQLVAALG